jgi:hypothetical protein
MNVRPWLALGVLAAAVSVVSFGQESESPPATEGEAAEQPPETEEPRTLEEIFIPSEEIAADEEVTFPINI